MIWRAVNIKTPAARTGRIYPYIAVACGDEKWQTGFHPEEEMELYDGEFSITWNRKVVVHPNR